MSDAQLDMHPLRELLYEEMHSRPFQVIPSPARISHLSVVCNEQQKAEQFLHLQKLCELLDGDVPKSDQACFQQQFGQLQVRREKHMEFVSYTFIWLGAGHSDPFAKTGISHLPVGWLDTLCGKIVAAFHVSVEDVRDKPEPDIPEVKSYFEAMRLVGSQPSQGCAQVWTSFQMHSDDFGRFLIYNRSMSDSQLGRLIQRLLEIESYRLMTLLGLPVARAISPHLQVMDQQLAQLTQVLSAEQEEDGQCRDERQLLARLTQLASQVEDYRAQSTFRFNATNAYQDLVLSRLQDLREDEVSGHLTLQEFITRRLVPAVKTCQAVADRLEDLSRRIDRVSDMLRTQVELSIQGQNQELLSSMDQRSKIQLMMQHTVEGLSVAAISYYTIGLVKIFIGVLYDQGLNIDKSLTLGVSMPLVIVAVALITRRIHSKFSKLADDSSDAKPKL
ncbi:DUF3422 family protein [Amphritea balenae]|uniref:DUF3422 domain-containing protein n=1 Tax=Amphritea balenae TaxID=452629 RepID=A0A3P1SHA2_9GAMM|nr:DUF3422 domain-containing protein [Amphritea balenae]RRC96661.1 DUF3422 domain-containing protein [Amphritea balenae]GGK74711.1 hypothetical protein GCM10007941_25970 [Amphritea balenae]